jgi:hypothetical protein
MFCILWFSSKEDIWNVKKLELYHYCITMFVLLLAVQNGAQKDMLYLGALFNP